MKKIYTLKVYPNGLGREVYRVFEISGENTLDDLCRAILDYFEFYDEHMYEFSMKNKMYEYGNYVSQSEYDEPSTDIALDKLGLAKGQKFLFHYDFGDDWAFTVNVQKISESEEYKETTLLKEKGEIRQY
ncbi:MAG: hypothetical protein IJ583_09175 [Firmicutes bacterium]|nr:hypothetical protein [Bacillota bacterium]